MNLNRNTNNKIKDLVFIVPFALLLIVVNILRIINIPITHDETGYRANESYFDLIFTKIPAANNHILNSLIRKFFIENVSDTLFFIRVGSLAAQVVFLIYAYLLCKKLFKERLWVLLSFFIFNTVSPFLFDFWGLSRGYGLGFCFMTASVYYLVSYHLSGKFRLFVFSFLAAALTIYSNYAFMNYYFALCGVVVLMRALFKDGLFSKQLFGKEILFAGGLSVLLAALITHNLIVLHGGGELVFLGHNGFIEDTVKSLVDWNLFMPDKDVWVGPAIKIASIIIVSGCALYWLLLFVRHKVGRVVIDARQQISFIFLLLLLLPVLSLFLQNVLLGIPYLVDRTALFFILLFIFNLIYIIYTTTKLSPCTGLIAVVVIAIIVGGNFFVNMNISSTRMWWYDAEDIVVLNRVVALHGDRQDKIRLRADGFHIPALKYDIEHYYKGKFYAPEETSSPLPQDSLADNYFIWVDNKDTLPAIYKKDIAACGGGCVLYHKN